MRILVVDDDLGSRLIAKATVERLDHECITAADGDEAWRLFNELPPHVLVSDRRMPGLNGLELCRRIRAAELDSYTYIVLVTSLSDPEDVREGMRAGADDYVSKPLNPFDLEMRLVAAERVTELHAELSRTREALTRQANTDPLTGLRNRLRLTQDLESIHRVSARYGRSYGLALCDVDHFKRYNDTYGHPAGDEALLRVAHVLQAGVRDVDRVYRYGGEEFLLLLPEQNVTGTQVVMERLVHDVRALAVEHRAGGSDGILTMSIGIASYDAERSSSVVDVLAAADKALYLAKSAGRNRIASVTGAGAPAAH